ncbi:MAG: hypothetical protein ACI8PZ_005581 [Myxococcota bacterium]|jgi:uncharacterized protein (DUF1778 family)
MASKSARLQLRIAPESKQLIETAAAVTKMSVTRFVTDAVVARVREVLEGADAASARRRRPVGGWCFPLPEGWDEPLDDMADTT